MSDQVLSHRQDIYVTITTNIIETMTSGTGKFKMPWHTADNRASLPTNASTEASYRGINILALWAEAIARNYPFGLWASYRQWQKVGAQVRKGERGTTIVFYKKIEDETDETERPRHILTASRVFNVAQVEGWIPPDVPRIPEFEIDKRVEAFTEAIGAKVRHGFATACYRLDLDDIEMPSAAWFVGTATSSPSQSYHAVRLHETIHWSGAPHRLNRQFGQRFGDQAYAFEELVAELGAAFLCAIFGIANEPRPDHAAYLSAWLKVLRDDRKAIFAAASQAQQAVEYLRQLAGESA